MPQCPKQAFAISVSISLMVQEYPFIQSFFGSSFKFSEKTLNLRPAIFNGIQLGTIRRQEQNPGSGIPDQIERFLVFMGRSVIENDDHASTQILNEKMFYIIGEHRAVESSLETEAVQDAFETQSSDQAYSFSFARRALGVGSFSFGRASVKRGHIQNATGFVDENAVFRGERYQLLTIVDPFRHVFAVVFSRIVKSFFFLLNPRRLRDSFILDTLMLIENFSLKRERISSRERSFSFSIIFFKKGACFGRTLGGFPLLCVLGSMEP